MNDPKKCRIVWTEGPMAGLSHDSWIYNPAQGKIVNAMWGQGTFRIEEIYDDQRTGNRDD